MLRRRWQPAGNVESDRVLEQEEEEDKEELMDRNSN